MGCCSSSEIAASGELVEVGHQSLFAPETDILPQIKVDSVPPQLPLEVLQGVLPPDDNPEERERFMSKVTVEDIVEDNEGAQDAIIVQSPTMRQSITLCRDEATDSTQATLQDNAAASMKPRERLNTAADVMSLQHWWGVGPRSPDPRLEAGMSGHVVATEVIDVMVRKPDDIENLLKELPLDDLCCDGQKYVLWQIKVGKSCLLSLHHVVDDDVYERVLHAQGGDLLCDSLKFIVNPVNLKVSLPVKGPKNADTIGTFFGTKTSHYSRCRPGDSSCKYDVAMITIDLYSVWSLKMLLPSVAFKVGRMVDFHLVSYRDNAVLATYRAAMTPEAVELLKKIDA